MAAFNLSVDFEMGWGDLDRLAVDDVFYRRVLDGNGHATEVIQLLGGFGLPSTWGVVGACGYAHMDELRQDSPRPFQAIESQLQTLMSRRADYSKLLFCGETIQAIAAAKHIELASHGFLHLVAPENEMATLREDTCASVRALGKYSAKPVQSFIAPRNYYWPDDAFLGTPIKYVRHAPNILGQTYSDVSIPAKFARLWNDFILPARALNSRGDAALLIYLRIDRGDSLWSAQLRLIRRLLTRGSGFLYCYTHPHNLDSPHSIGRLRQLCDLVAECRDQGSLTCPPFAREVRGATSAAVNV